MSEHTKRPVIERQIQNVRMKIWENQRENGIQYAATFSKVYRDKDGNLREAQSFGPGDLAIVSHLSSRGLDDMQRFKGRDRKTDQQKQPRQRCRDRDQERER